MQCAQPPPGTGFPALVAALGSGERVVIELTERPGMPKQIAPFLMFQNADAEQAMSFYASLFKQLFAALCDGGTQLMPLGDHGFSRRFGWVNDRFGVPWQLNLA
jgi:predicted 3-demethylubiquinone-9 3-methyltransferase (glyoxalase superfamily)